MEIRRTTPALGADVFKPNLCKHGDTEMAENIFEQYSAVEKAGLQAGAAMGELILVRHGQANSGATSEEDYDRLSLLGHRQAGWLGEWFGAHEAPFDRVYCGTMRRHRETAKDIGLANLVADPRLNELDYFTLAKDMEIAHGIPLPMTQQDFANHIPRTLKAWHDQEIAGAEPFARFEMRIKTVLAEAAAPGRRVLCVTSGGVIAMSLRIALGLDMDRLVQVLLAIFNSSVHRFRVVKDGTFLTSFNAVPHLDDPERAEARTWV